MNATRFRVVRLERSILTARSLTDVRLNVVGGIVDASHQAVARAKLAIE